MALNASIMSSASADWNTPDCVLSLVREVFGDLIDLDPCSNLESIVAARESCHWPRRDGLDVNWHEFDTVYVNPPYGRGIGMWLEKCTAEAEKGAEIIALLPSRTDAGWFRHAWTADAVCFWRGRLRFLGAPSSAPFPSVLAYWGPNRFRFADVFSRVGKVVFP